MMGGRVLRMHMLRSAVAAEAAGVVVAAAVGEVVEVLLELMITTTPSVECLISTWQIQVAATMA